VEVAEGRAARDTVREGQDRVLGSAAAGWVGAELAEELAQADLEALLPAAGCGCPAEGPELAGEARDPVVGAARVLALELGEALDPVELGAVQAPVVVRVAARVKAEEPAEAGGLAGEVARGAVAEAREVGLVVDLEGEAGPEVGVQVSGEAGARVVAAGLGEELARARRGNG
jgi:hypothetical protein